MCPARRAGKAIRKWCQSDQRQREGKKERKEDKSQASSKKVLAMLTGSPWATHISELFHLPATGLPHHTSTLSLGWEQPVRSTVAQTYWRILEQNSWSCQSCSLQQEILKADFHDSHIPSRTSAGITWLAVGWLDLSMYPHGHPIVSLAFEQPRGDKVSCKMAWHEEWVCQETQKESLCLLTLFWTLHSITSPILPHILSLHIPDSSWDSVTQEVGNPLGDHTVVGYTCTCMHAQSHPTLFNPMDCRPLGSSVHGILQARILEWATIPSPEDLPDPGIEPASPVSAGGFFTTELPGKSHMHVSSHSSSCACYKWLAFEVFIVLTHWIIQDNCL